MKLWGKVAIGVGLVVVVGGLVFYNLRTSTTGGSASTTGGSAGNPRGDGPAVNVVKVQPATMKVAVLAPGTVDANQDTDVRAPIASAAVTLRVTAGDKVKAGQVLAQLDVADLQQQLSQQKGALQQAISQLAMLQRQQADGGTTASQQVSSAATEVESAKANLLSMQQTLGQQADSARQSLEQVQRDLAALQAQPSPAAADAAQQQADQIATLQQKLTSLQSQLTILIAADNPSLVQAQLRLESANAGLKRVREQQGRPAVLSEQFTAAQQAVESAQAAMQRLEEQVTKSEVKAPFEATVLAVDVKDGQPVQTGSRILELGRLDSVLVKIRVDEVDVGQVVPGQTVTVKTVAHPDATFTGQVTRVAPQAMSANTPGSSGAPAFEVQAETQNPTQKLLPGMSSDTEILIAKRDNALAVGLETLTTENKENYLWVVRDGVVYKVQVQLGLRSKTQAEITQGLQAGDQVVVGPFATLKTLKDGSPVKATVLKAKEGEAQ